MIEVSARVVSKPDVRQNKAVKKGVNAHLKRRAGEGFQISQEKVPKDTSELMFSGIPPTKSSKGGWFWAYDAPHALPVEYGSRPHWVPIDALKGWARRVLGDESAAYAVQQKIAEFGTQPQPYVRPAVEHMKRGLRTSSVALTIKEFIP